MEERITMNLWDDPRIVRGMTTQFALRRQRLDGGDKLLGWKVGFGTPALLKQLNISGPLIGFLTQNARVAPGSTVSLAGWAKPVAEPEVAVHIGSDVAAGATPETAAAAIVGISPAFELVDLHEPPTDPERILSHDIYQRHVVLAGATPARAGAAADGLTCRIMRHGAEFARTTDPQANTGRWVDIVSHVANVLGGFGERLRAGEVIITGSVVPPIAIEPDESSLTFALDPVGAVSVNFKR
jgi:2-keto-4-pentenoate hydratase